MIPVEGQPHRVLITPQPGQALNLNKPNLSALPACDRLCLHDASANAAFLDLTNKTKQNKTKQNKLKTKRIHPQTKQNQTKSNAYHWKAASEETPG
jgi:hypothetical protein